MRYSARKVWKAREIDVSRTLKLFTFLSFSLQLVRAEGKQYKPRRPSLSRRRHVHATDGEIAHRPGVPTRAINKAVELKPNDFAAAWL